MRIFRLKEGVFFSIILLLDRMTKFWAVSFLGSGDYHLCDGLSFSLIYNEGIACGLFSGWGPIARAVIILATIILLVVMLRQPRDAYTSYMITWGEVLMLAGGGSNLFDRMVYGHVIDFIKISCGDYVFPIFNVADVSVTSGLFLIVLSILYCRESN